MKRLLAFALLSVALVIGTGAQFPFSFWKKAAAAGGAATLSSATVASNGTTVTLAFSGTVTHTTGTEPAIAMTAGASGTSPGAATLVYASGSGTSSLVYTFTRTAKAHNLTAVETSAVSFTSGALDCAAFGPTGTTNNSTQKTFTLRDSFSGTKEDTDSIGYYSGSNHRARKFVSAAGVTYKATEIAIPFFKYGSPTFNLKTGIRADDGGSPSAPAAISGTTSNAVAASTINETDTGVDVVFSGLVSGPIVNGTPYWIYGFNSDGSDPAGNAARWNRFHDYNADTLVDYSSDGITWINQGNSSALIFKTYSSP